jgi:predicted transcriptional regulator
MPLEAFWTAAQKASFSPDALALEFSVDLHAVFRRLATLRRSGMDAPSFGLVIVNAAGQPILRRPLEDFSLPRFSSICALWPAFQALSLPGQPLSEIIVLPNGREFLAQAIALPASRPQFNSTPAFLSAMLVTSLGEAHRFGMLEDFKTAQSRQVGTSCRLCQRTNCLARSEPSILPP